MAKTKLIPGFRFHPTSVELVKYFLKRKVIGKKFYDGVIAELDIYKYAPWDLPDKSCLRTGDLEWYFFCAREKKYGSGARMNRATEIGYWKTTGKDRAVQQNNKTVGMIKTLIFHIGKAPLGERTNWVMHEYRLEDKDLTDKGIAQDSYVICKVFQKEGLGPRNGAQYGRPFSEEDWDDEEAGIPFALSASAPILPMASDSSVPNDKYLPASGSIGSTSISCLSGSMLSPGPTVPSHLAITSDSTVPNNKHLPASGYIGSNSMSCLSGSMLSPSPANPSNLAITSSSFVPNDKHLPFSGYIDSASTSCLSGLSPSPVTPSHPIEQAFNNDEDEDILSMLDIFKEGDALPKVVDNLGKENVAEGAPLCDTFEGLGDPDNWAGFDGFSAAQNAEFRTNGMATTGDGITGFDDLEFIELIDLDSPFFWQTSHP